jgi:hypothetical protein
VNSVSKTFLTAENYAATSACWRGAMPFVPRDRKVTKLLDGHPFGAIVDKT